MTLFRNEFNKFPDPKFNKDKTKSSNDILMKNRKTTNSNKYSKRQFYD